MSTSSALVTASAAAPEEDAELPVDLSQLPSIPVPKSLLLINNFVANTTRFLNHFAHECEERITKVSDNVTRVEILLAILEAKLNSIPDLSVSEAEIAAADTDGAPVSSQIDLGISDQDLPSMEVSNANETPLPPPPPPPQEIEDIEGGLPPLPPPPPSIDGMEGALVVPPPPPPSSLGEAFDDDEDEEKEVQNEGPPVLKLKDDPVYAKYFTMRRLGIPDQVIEHKLLMDDMDTAVLSMDPEGPSPSGGLAPMPDSEPTDSLFGGGPPAPPLPPLPPPPSTSRSARSVSEESSSDDDIEEFDADGPPSAPADSGVLKLKDDPAFEKYFKMRKLGMPDGVIQHKLTMDGVTLDILNMDPEGPSPNATGAAPVPPAVDVAQPPLPPGLPPPPPVKKYDDSDSDFDSD
ncbi:hypothetical protein JM18_007583 [Phytophthora kernoviae]|uniref:Uncharacterized protein n=1 Tax=Phytophthora kernoviae TaxID=325452 RepID=A0A921SES5_9STRA|nr:hypothetical protein JM18_007583 [Phytophthora kernoviae]